MDRFAALVDIQYSNCCADLVPALPAHELAVHRDDLTVNDLIADSAPVIRYATSKYFVSA